nr:immunoglobulin heavy chain junction region [Mus musculus]NSM05879.1 immunoglobulin heavy chain junction region [Mus musculus]NSM09624.1 immunoglobulin heavy chain junction region [Mus musculus]NSM09704.1 immunoglobulin heavy chain junction region [Mus musculus]
CARSAVVAPFAYW